MPIGRAVASAECQLAGGRVRDGAGRTDYRSPVSELAVRPVLPAEYDALGDLVVAAYRSTRTASSAASPTSRDRGRSPSSSATAMPGIRMLAVSPSAHRRGVGRRLVEACIDRARADGRSRIVLHTAASMTAAQALYVGLGFVRAPHLDRLVPAAHLMAYTLDLHRT